MRLRHQLASELFRQAVRPSRVSRRGTDAQFLSRNAALARRGYRLLPMAGIERRALLFATGSIPLFGQASPAAAGLTRTVAEFIVQTRYEDIPADVIELGRKSILDSIGLALAGSVAHTGEIGREYVQSLGLVKGAASVIGSSLRVAPRFAALLNGLGIHADDYDDTQLAVAADRTYGLRHTPAQRVWRLRSQWRRRRDKTVAI